MNGAELKSRPIEGTATCGLLHRWPTTLSILRTTTFSKSGSRTTETSNLYGRPKCPDCGRSVARFEPKVDNQTGVTSP